jgi:uncharacterized damage-inducible protein DinB
MEVKMSMPDLIRSYLEYNDAMNRRVWESVKQLTDEQFVSTIEYSHGSIRDLMVHMAAVDGRWMRGLKGVPDARSYNLEPDQYPTIKKAYQVWDQTAVELLEFAHSLDEISLNQTPIGMHGPIWQVLLHLVNHGTDHRAQVLRVLHDFGAPTFDQDYILFQWFKT